MTNSALPHSSAIRADIKQYLSDASGLASNAVNSAVNSDVFRNIYKVTLATDAVLLELSEDLIPHRDSLRSGFRRIPVLIALSQPDAASYQLRQMIEITHLIIYFSQHPVEWQSYLNANGSKITLDQSLPIQFSASRPPVFFRSYALERFGKEPSGTAKNALNTLAVSYTELSRVVHGSKGVIAGKLEPEFTQLTQKEINCFKAIYSDVAASCCLALMAFNVSAYNQLPPATNAWFGWLVGKDVNNKIKSGPFGLSDAF